MSGRENILTFNRILSTGDDDMLTVVMLVCKQPHQAKDILHGIYYDKLANGPLK